MEGFAARSQKPVCVSWPSPPLGIPERLAARASTPSSIRSGACRLSPGSRRSRRASAGALSARGGGLSAFDWGRTSTADRPPRRPGGPLPPHPRGGGPARAAARLVRTRRGRRAAAEARLSGGPEGHQPERHAPRGGGFLAVDLRIGPEVTPPPAAARGSGPGDRGRARRVYVQKMHRGGTELLFAAFRDPMFGVMVSCGAAGPDGAHRRRRTARAPVDRRTRRACWTPADPALRRATIGARCQPSPSRPFSRASRARAHGAMAPLRLRGESREVDAGRRRRRGRPAYHRRTDRCAREPAATTALGAGPPASISRGGRSMRRQSLDTRDGRPGEARRKGPGEDTAPVGSITGQPARVQLSCQVVRLRPAGVSLGPAGRGQHHGYRARAHATPSAGRSINGLFGPGLPWRPSSCRTRWTCSPASSTALRRPSVGGLDPEPDSADRDEDRGSSAGGTAAQALHGDAVDSREAPPGQSDAASSRGRPQVAGERTRRQK